MEYVVKIVEVPKHWKNKEDSSYRDVYYGAKYDYSETVVWKKLGVIWDEWDFHVMEFTHTNVHMDVIHALSEVMKCNSI